MRGRVAAGTAAMLLVAALAAFSVARLRAGGGDEERGGEAAAGRREGDSAEGREPGLAAVAASARGAGASMRGVGAGPGETATALSKDGVPCSIVGTAVDEHRRPIPGATATLDGEVTGATSAPTGPDGQFDVHVRVAAGTRWLRGAIVVVEGERRSGIASFDGPPGRIDVGRVELAASAPLTVAITDEGRPVPRAAVTVWAVDQGDEVMVREVTAGEDGRATLLGLPAGMLHLLAVGPTGRRARAEVAAEARGPGPVEVGLQPAAVLRVRVLEADGTSPIEHATVSVSACRHNGEDESLWEMDYRPALTVPPTDADGRTTVVGLCLGEMLEVEASAPGRARAQCPFARPADPATHPEEVVLRLGGLRTVSWPVVAAERPVPPADTVVRLRCCPPYSRAISVPETGRMEGGRLVAVGLEKGDVHAIATAPDGSIAEIHATAGSKEGPPTSFRAPRRIEVAVADETGAPVAGVRVVAWDSAGEAWSPVVATDGKGIAVLKGLPGRELRAAVGVTRAGYGPCVTRAVDLREKDVRVGVTIGAPREIVLRVRTEGEPVLPSHLGGRVGEGLYLEEEEDPESATLRLRVRPFDPAGEASVTVSAPGWTDYEWRGRWPPPAVALVLEADLRREASLEVDVKAPADLPLDLELETPFENGTAWLFHASLEGADRTGPHAVAGIAPGRYRARDMTTGGCTEEIVIPEPPQSRRVVLDLSGAYEVSGRVDIPQGYEPGEARVVVEGPRIDVTREDQPPGVEVDRESLAFRVWVPWPGPVSLGGRHPRLLTATEGGRVTVTGPRDDVVLRLLEGPRLLFVPRAPTNVVHFADSLTQDGEILITPSAGSPSATPLRRLGIEWLERGGGRVTGLGPGTYTLFVDVAPYAPVVLRGVAVGPGATDLGEVSFERGSSVDVTLEAPPALGVVGVSAGTESIEEPRYGRSSVTVDRVERIRGLGAGRHLLHVTWTCADGRSGSREREIEVDGVHDATVEFDAAAK